MRELASLLGVICALISLRCCWENNSGIKRPDRKIYEKKGETHNFVLSLELANYSEMDHNESLFCQRVIGKELLSGRKIVIFLARLDTY